MGVTISVNLQKGGVGKSTTTGILAYLLSKRGKRVLVVDMDSQGNVSTLLAQRPVFSFQFETIAEAVFDQDPKAYMVSINAHLDLLPADDLLALYPELIKGLAEDQLDDDGSVIAVARQGHPITFLKQTLEIVKSEYDFILIDCPPSLDERTTSALTAADYVLTVMQCETYAFEALPRFFETLLSARLNNPKMVMLGISAQMLDRYGLNNDVLELAREQYGDIVFNAVIRRLARIAEFSAIGIQETRQEQRDALRQYEELLDEVLARIENPVADAEIYVRALENRLYFVQEKLQTDRLKDERYAVERERFVDLEKLLVEQLQIARRW